MISEIMNPPTNTTIIGRGALHQTWPVLHLNLDKSPKIKMLVVTNKN